MKIRPISEELQQKAVAELGEDPKRIEEDIKYIREWAQKQPHLRIRTDDQWVLACLRSEKFRYELVKQKFESLSIVKAAFPEYFANRDPLSPKFQEILSEGACLPLLKTLGETGPVVVLFRIGNCDKSKYEVPDAILLLTTMVDFLANHSDNATISGYHMIVDAAGLELQDAFRVTPNYVKQLLKIFYRAYNIRPQGIHVINANPVINFLYNQLKDVLVSTKLIDRIYFYSPDNRDKLYETIPLSLLPKEYGGDGEPLEELTKIWKKKIEDFRSWFLEDSIYCLDASKQPLKLDMEDEAYKMQGSFRKLELD